MTRRNTSILLSLCITAAVASAQPAPELRQAAPPGEPTMELGMGGVGGLYLLAEPGPLWIEIYKRDRNKASSCHANLQAVFFGPDRQVIDEQTIPDDGVAKKRQGSVQSVRFFTTVEHKGVYGINITVSGDPFGYCSTWGFRTDCPKFLIETSRGRRPWSHQEPIIFSNPGVPANICFMPLARAFSIDVKGLPASTKEVTLLDAADRQLAVLPVSTNGTATQRFEPGALAGTLPLQFRLPEQEGTIQIDGVTRWHEGDPYKDLSYWTTQPDAWFPFREYRWLLTPYNRTIYAQPGEQHSVPFQVHNNSGETVEVALAVEVDDMEAWKPILDAQRLTLEPNEATTVDLKLTVPQKGEKWECRVRATPLGESGFTTYSTVIAKRGKAPAADPLDIPLVLKPYRRENQLFGYLPDYPTDAEPYFDSRNRPYILTEDSLFTLQNGAWSATHLCDAIHGMEPEKAVSRTSKVAFDGDDDIYLVATVDGMPHFLHSSDGGLSFDAHEVNGGVAFDIEQFSGHNYPSGPPPFLRYSYVERVPNVGGRYKLELFAPEKAEDGITWPNPTLISERCTGLSAHSGIPASIVSRGSQIHIVWAEITDAGVTNVPGVPTFAVTYDRQAGQLGQPVLLGYGPPRNDHHNSPSITMDSRGYLHVLLGTHNAPFPYTRSLKPNTAGGGWTEAEVVGKDLEQTYIGLVCDRSDTLHLVSRLWQTGTVHFPSALCGVLAHLTKHPGEAWSHPEPLIIPPFSEYSIYYHRLTIDHAGDLFLSYDYSSTYWFLRNDVRTTRKHSAGRRALLMSPDAGVTWKLAETGDMMARLESGK